MKKLFAIIAVAALVDQSTATQAGEVKPVRMGKGSMSFDTVPGWGLDKNGKSGLGSTHGGVVVDKKGNVYVSANKGVVVFSSKGQKIREYVTFQHTAMHDIEIREEDGVEYIYGARNNNREGVKFRADNGKVVLNLPFPKESGLNPIRFKPTAVTVAPNGDIYLADGYASNVIFVFDKNGKYKSHFGKKGNGLKEFNTCHGMTLDTRYNPPRLLICDRNHKPKGRMLHYSLEGEFIGVVIEGLGMPTSVAVQGNYASIPDLHGYVTIIGKDNKIVATLGKNPDPKQGRNFRVKQADWVEGAFSGTHGSYWGKNGDLYVQDWNIDGRIMKLSRVRK
ncbi:MAG: 6-bladed beta-propeller [Verrucomicrobiales bacterium]|nr:6-bladed beta-propeller [Verrucomicrobiales bacterium]|tara:strand:- start:11994 stop:12998 length:1005 start_codon:yes stop_codon:yes gene_type:complete